MRLAGSYARRSEGKYRVHMRDGDDENSNDWARYLREITSRPDWSVARLARDSGIHRSTIFRWLEGGPAKTVTVRSVQLIAQAAGEDVEVALRAAGSVLDQEGTEDEIDFEIQMIEQSNLPRGQKNAMIREARRLRDRQLAERKELAERQLIDRREQVRTWLDIAGGGTQAAT